MTREQMKLKDYILLPLLVAYLLAVIAGAGLLTLLAEIKVIEK
jgi:hypothetical protein